MRIKLSTCCYDARSSVLAYFVVKERAATANDMSTPANIISDVTVGLPGAVRAHIVEKM